MLPNKMRLPARSRLFIHCFAGARCRFLRMALHKPYQGKQLITLRSLPTSKVVVPGKPFMVGLLLRMAPGWHTYWKFSGDAGLPSEIKWNCRRAGKSERFNGRFR